jgi:hypothetical protein
MCIFCRNYPTIVTSPSPTKEEKKLSSWLVAYMEVELGSERRVLLRLRRRHHHRLLLRLRRGHELRRLLRLRRGHELRRLRLVVVGLLGRRHRAVRPAVLLREVVVHRSSPTCGREGGSDLTSPGRCGNGGGGVQGEKRRIAARRCELGQGALCANSNGEVLY